MSQRRPPKDPLDHDPEALRQAIKETKPRPTNRQIAEALGCSESLVSEMVAGTRNANDERIAALAEYLGCPVWILKAKEPAP